jgi:hypothetical protein
MDKSEMKNLIIKNITSKLGYNYSESKLDKALERGILDGDVVMSNGQITVKVEGTLAVARNPKGEQIGQAMDLSNADYMDKCLIMYATTFCQNTSICGK